MITNVYLYDRAYIDEMFRTKNDYIKKHPEKYLFSYEGEFKWEWYCIQVGGKYYRFCVGDVKGTDPATYLVEPYSYRPEMEQLSTRHDAYCPACGHVIDWEEDDGLVTCSQCHSKVEKRTFVETSYFDDFMLADYHTHLVELYKPHRLSSKKIKVLNEV